MSTLRVAWLSFAASVFILLVKFLGYHLTGSKAVLSDAMESIVNVVAALAALTVMKQVAVPADDDHPYGHGKLEFFSSAFEGGLIASASVLIAIEAVSALIQGTVLTRLDAGAVLMTVAALGNLALGLLLRRTGERHKSEALKASGQHILSDVYTTGGALLSLLLVWLTGWMWVDPALALLLAFFLAWTGIRIIRRSVGGLLDETDPKAVGELAQALEDRRFPGLIDIHHLKIIRSGRFHHVDAHLVMPRFWDVFTAHQLGEKYEKEVVAAYPYDGEINFHIDPCEDRYCSICDLASCAIRGKAFEERKSFRSISLTEGPKT